MLRDITFPADEKKFNEKCLLAVAGGPLSFEDRLSARRVLQRCSKNPDPVQVRDITRESQQSRRKVLHLFGGPSPWLKENNRGWSRIRTAGLYVLFSSSLFFVGQRYIGLIILQIPA